MMLTGIVSLVVNWNPLIKLDGYYMLCEVIGIAELKEDSTAYLSAWVRRHIWRLPVDVTLRSETPPAVLRDLRAAVGSLQLPGAYRCRAIRGKCLPAISARNGPSFRNMALRCWSSNLASVCW